MPPCWSLTVSTARRVRSLTTRTVAPGIAPPDASRTVPVMAPRSTCAKSCGDDECEHHRRHEPPLELEHALLPPHSHVVGFCTGIRGFRLQAEVQTRVPSRRSRNRADQKTCKFRPVSGAGMPAPCYVLGGRPATGAGSQQISQRFRRSLASPEAGPVDLQLAHARPQRMGIDPQQPRRTVRSLDPPARFGQRRLDVPPDDHVERLDRIRRSGSGAALNAGAGRGLSPSAAATLSDRPCPITPPDP